MEKCPYCGSENLETTYDLVPYGSTNVQMESGLKCNDCNEEI